MTGRTAPRRYSFFAHFNRVNMQRGKPEVWTIHFRGRCIQAEGIEFNVPLYTRYVGDGPQPRATLRGRAVEVVISNGYATVR